MNTYSHPTAERTTRVRCAWCHTANEWERKICGACGLTLPEGSVMPSAREAPPTEEPEKAPRHRNGWMLAGGIVPVLMVIAAGGWAYAHHTERMREELRQLEADNTSRLAAVERQRSAQAERDREADAERRHQDELKRRIPEVHARSRDYLRRGDFALGLSVVNDLLRQVESPELLETKVDLLNNAGRWNEAYLELKKLLTQRPEEAYLHVAAANFALNVEGPKAAMIHFDRAVRLAPGNTGYQILRAKSYVVAGRSEEGFAFFEEMIAQDAECIDCWFHYGDSLFGAGQMERAISVFRKGAEKFPESARHRFHLAYCLDAVAHKTGERSRLTEAAAQYRQSLELQPMPHSRAAQRILEITGQRVPPELEAMSSDEVELQALGKVSIVRATLNGVEGRFILDTGASETCVFSHAARRFHIRTSRRVAEAKTANGKIQAPVAYGTIQVGKQKQSGAIILLLPPGERDGIDGLLGADFMRTFGGQIDLVRQRLILRGPREE